MRLIDADKLLRTLNEKGIPFNAEINDVIDDAPTVEVIPKVTCERTRGKWILPNDCVARYLDEWICSNCSHLISHRHNFCPNCGAYMLGGRRNERFDK